MSDTTVEIDKATKVKSSNLYTKAEYARKIGNSQTWVDKLIEQKKLREIEVNGGSFVCEIESLIKG